MPGALSPLRNRSFAVYWTGAFISNIGTWMETVALGYYVADRTGKGVWVAIIAAAAFVPTGLIGPIGGALADRWDRRKILIYGNVVEAILAALLASLVASHHLVPAAAAVIVFGAGCASALAFPAFSSMVPDLVPPEDLVRAISLNSAQWNLGRIVGPTMAGIVISAWGSAWAFWINAISFGAVLIALSMIRVPPRVTTSTGPVLAAVRQGLRFTQAEPGLRAVTRLMALGTFFAAPFIALLPDMGKKVLRGNAHTVSWLVTAQGVGAVIAALNMGRLAARYGSRRVLQRSLALLPVALMLYAVAPNLPLVCLALVPLGGLYLASLNCYSSIAQTRAPAHFRGRVLAINIFILGVFYPVSSLIQGALADVIGLRWATASYAIALAAALVAIRMVKPNFLGPIDQPVDATDLRLADAFSA